jgi:hypothetical protein
MEVEDDCGVGDALTVARATRRKVGLQLPSNKMAWRTTALLAIIAGALHGALAVDYHWIFQTNTSIPCTKT